LLEVNIADVKELRQLNYNWKQIARLLGISRATLYRRLKDSGIKSYTEISNEELDDCVRAIKQIHPNDGEILLQGHLRSRDINVPRQLLRDSIHRVDGSSTYDRRRLLIQRRIYSVPYPNYIWHLDGHHKLIRWRFVIHGAIDGFTRMVTFLHCSNNNCAETVLNNFVAAVNQFGLPDHVRTDHGGENFDVWKYVIASHNFNYSSVITGSSVHNERIERFWRDVNRCVCQHFSGIFRSLEADGSS
jgi:AraC-like DNA-binding protein